jgi:hypothetical protein
MRFGFTVSRPTAISAGHDKYGYGTVDVPIAEFSADERELLSRLPAQTAKADIDLDAFHTFLTYPESYEPFRALLAGASRHDAETTKLLVKGMMALYQELLRKRREAKEEEERAEAAKVEELRAQPAEALLEQQYNKLWCPNVAVRNRKDALPDKFAEVEAEAKRRNDVILAEREQEKAEAARKAAEAEAARQKGLADLKLWAEEAGSELLKARIAYGFEWAGLAMDEFCGAVVAGAADGLKEADELSDYKFDKLEVRKNPTLDEIKVLLSARAKLEGKPAAADLVYVTYERTEDDDSFIEDDDEDEPFRRTELRLTVTTPTGDNRDYFYLV